ncbi:DUSP13 isoform 2 [Pan troglodytes]|uniref:DUSP13 isoform 2 n=1 Tax=Pan troglodytes TaxID=9598 RepID=A0A2J8NU90_PANTR|nr:DUSP13 isoform 2 [Pan troglodytes]
MAETSLPELGGEDKATPCPTILELEELLRAGKSSCSRVDEVWPNLFIGDARGPGTASLLVPWLGRHQVPFLPSPGPRQTTALSCGSWASPTC